MQARLRGAYLIYSCKSRGGPTAALTRPPVRPDRMLGEPRQQAYASKRVSASPGGRERLTRTSRAGPVAARHAPCLVLPFLAGWTQREPKRAALLGLASTLSALTGYGLMTLSPIEGAELTLTTIRGFVLSSSPVIVGGLFTGPLFGWLGNRWRNDRAWLGALAVAGAFCLQPLARKIVDGVVPAGHAISFRTVAVGEVVVGVAMVAYVAAAALAAQRARRHTA